MLADVMLVVAVLGLQVRGEVFSQEHSIVALSEVEGIAVRLAMELVDLGVDGSFEGNMAWPQDDIWVIDLGMDFTAKDSLANC